MLKNISIPEKLEKDIEKKLIGAYYSNLSDVIEDGLRKVLKDYETEKRLNTILKLYQEDKITAREASDLLGISLRETYEILSKHGVYIRYGEEELKEDFE